LADELPVDEMHGRRPADSANGRRSKDSPLLSDYLPADGTLAAVRPRDFGISRSQLYAEPTPIFDERGRVSPTRQRIRREVADIEHRTEQCGFRQDRLRLRNHVRG
jgi:hypothetical protein